MSVNPDFDVSHYGGADGDPNQFMSPNLPPPPPGPNMSAPPPGYAPPQNMSAVPPGYAPPSPQALPPTQVPEVNVQGKPPSAYEQAMGMTAGQLADQHLVSYGAQKAMPAHWQDVSRQGGMSPEEADKLKGYISDAAAGRMGAGFEGQNAEHMANQFAANAETYRMHQLEMQRQEAEKHQQMVAQQVQRDRQEYEGIKNAYQRDVMQGNTPMGTLPGALATIGGMLAIAMAAKGKRENLESTIGAVNGAIDQQVKAMQAKTAAEGQAANNAYSRFLQSYGNQEQAEAATKALLNQQISSQLDRMKIQGQSPMIDAKYADLQANLNANADEQMANVDKGAYGVVAAQMVQARAGHGAGLRRMTLAEEQNRQKFNAEMGKTGAETGKLNAETGKTIAEGQNIASGAEGLEKGTATWEKTVPLKNTLDAATSLQNELSGSGTKDFMGLSEHGHWTKAGKFELDAAMANNPEAAKQAAALNVYVEAKAQMLGKKKPGAKEELGKELLASADKEGLSNAVGHDVAQFQKEMNNWLDTLPLATRRQYEKQMAASGGAQAAMAQPGVRPDGVK